MYRPHLFDTLRWDFVRMPARCFQARRHPLAERRGQQSTGLEGPEAQQQRDTGSLVWVSYYR